MSSLHDNSMLDNPQTDPIAILGAHGARFTLIPSRSKAPRYSGWQRGGKTPAEAMAHARGGGNVGLLCGAYSGGLIVVDADKDAPALEAAFPILSQTLKTWRADAPDRAKWILKIDGALPPSKKDHDAGLEILADVSSGGGSNAVIYGIHDKGARIEHTGSTIVTMTAADLAEIWRWRTGTELDAGAQAHKTRQHRSCTGASAPTPARAAGATDPANVAVRRFNRENRITDVMQRLGYRWHHADRWVAPQSEHGTPSCQVNERAGHVWHYSTKNVTGREGKATAADLVCAHDFAGNADRFLESLTPSPATTDQAGDSEPAIDFAGLRQFARSGVIEGYVRSNLALLAEQVAALAESAAQAFASNPTDQTERAALALRAAADKAAARVTAPRWPEATVRRLMLAVIADFEAATERYPDLEAKHISTLGLAARANMGRNTVIDTLPLLLDWFVVREDAGAKRAPRYRLARVTLDVVRIAHVCHPADQSCAILTTSPLLSHFAHDAFRAHVTPLADTAENRSHVATVTAAIRSGANVKPKAGENILETLPAGPRELVREAMSDDDEKRRAQLASGYYYRQQRRFAATIASPGGRALLLLDHIDAMGGSCTGAALAQRTGWTRHEISRMIGRLEDAGCVAKPDRFTVQTCEDWQSTLDERVIEMPTFGSKAVLEAQLLGAREAYQTQRLQEAVDCKDPAQYEKMRIRIAAILVTLDTISKMRATLVSWAITTMQERHDPVLHRVLTRYASQDAREAAELRNRAAAGRRRLHSIEAAAASKVGYYRAWDLPEDAIVAKLMLAGYSGHTITEVMR